MFASRTGIRPVIASCALAACLSGCASTQNTQVYGYYDTGVPVQRTVAQAGVVMEDDGLPSQSPPPAHIRALPDEPDEPFSKNYGGSNPAAKRAGVTVHDSTVAAYRAPSVARPGHAEPALPWAARTVAYTAGDE